MTIPPDQPYDETQPRRGFAPEPTDLQDDFADATAVMPETHIPQAAPSAQPPQKKSWGKIIAVVAVALVIGIGIAVGFMMMNSSDDPKVGDCLLVQGNEQEASKRKVSCDDTSKGTTYTVVDVKTNGQSCEAEFMAVADTKGNQTTSYCLVPNLIEGKCYVESGTGAASSLEAVDCKPGEVTAVKIAKKLPQAGQTCDAEGSIPVSWSKPGDGVTYCVIPAQ